MNETNELQIFEEKNMVIFQQLAEFKKQKDRMEDMEAKLKADLERGMAEYGIKQFKNDLITISYVEGSTNETIDLKAMQVKEPKLYAELLEDYKKVTTRKPYVKFQVK